MASYEHLLRQYDYAYPPELIAKEPARPRDSARLLAYDRENGAVAYDVFRNIARYVPKGAVLVFNDTKVIPARLEVRKETGGRVRILYVSHKGSLIRCLADRALKPGERLVVRSHFFALVEGREGREVILRLPKRTAQESMRFFERYGTMPLPPYMSDSPLSEKRRKALYQTVFARARGSIAAPTASLHFTKRLIRALKSRGFGVEYITLHVGLGTFAPLTPDQLKRGVLHEEHYVIDSRTRKRLNAAKRSGRPIIAVGTTVTRALESSARGRGFLARESGGTDLFLRERSRLEFVDGLVTNFHVPRSSLMMLVSAFVGRKKLLELYRGAIREKFRLFSFGDAMLIV